MKTVLFILLSSLCHFGTTQTVFSETFDEADDATSGTDAIGAVAWTTTCPGSIAVTDYFKVVSGKLEAQDTNGPAATWTTDEIDITSCTSLQITLELEESGTMEECLSCGGTGTGCIDWAKLEYNLDGLGWTEVAGETCGLAEAPGEMIQIGDIPGGGPVTITSPCIDFGTTLQLRISCMCWAATERWRFDDITVTCLDCILPVEIIDFKVEESSHGIEINWTTLTERSNDRFLLERSYNGIDFETVKSIKGAGNSTTELHYETRDTNYLPGKTIYYRLTQFDFDQTVFFSETISITSEPIFNVHYGNGLIHYSVKNAPQSNLNIYDLNGHLIRREIIQNSGSFPWHYKGFFILEIPQLNLHKKLFIQ